MYYSIGTPNRCITYTLVNVYIIKVVSFFLIISMS